MNINISIDGVLRNKLNKLIYLYETELLPLNENPKDDFRYEIINSKINENKIEDFLKFHSKEEMDNFLYIDFALEIFGHSNVSYKGVFNDLNSLIYNNKKHKITLIGIDELGKAKPSTLFFLSKNGSLCNNIRFIKENEIEKEWKRCSLWVTANSLILDKKPLNKKGVLFETNYNLNIEINKINNIKKIEEYAK